MTDWAIPQQAKLKYTQLFNLHDRSHSGFLSGLQCRDILLQSGLPRNILAEIWNLSDIDGDGQLTREEFILAMHLTNHVRSGQNLPTELSKDLIPPSYRRTRSISATSVHSTSSAGSSSIISGNNNNTINDDQVSQKPTVETGVIGSMTANSILNSNSFEDKRRENFEKGRAELERRRLKIIEQQMGVLKEHLISGKKQVAEAKAKIDALRADRDTKMGMITFLEAQLKTLQDKKAYLNHEEISLMAIAKDLNLVSDPAATQAELDHIATEAKQKSIDQMKEKLGEFEREKEEKNKELVEVSGRLEESKKELKLISDTVSKTYETYKQKVADAKVKREQFITENKTQTANLDSVWDSTPSFISSSIRLEETQPVTNTFVPNEDPWSSKVGNDTISDSFSKSDLKLNPESILDGNGFGTEKLSSFSEQPLNTYTNNLSSKKYKALYAFEARNPDELTIEPGDVIIGREDVCEPGWLSGELKGHVGLFPEAYVESVPSDDDFGLTKTAIKSDVIPFETVSPNPIELLSVKQNEFNQDNSSSNNSAAITNIKYKVLYAFDARNPDELTIKPGDIIIGLEGITEPGWLSGLLENKKGLFPEAYVERMAETAEIGQDQTEASGKSRSKRAEVATVIANYRALGQEQLNLEKGQLVLIRRKMDSGWWEGEIQVKGKKKQFGWFPASYVKLLANTGGTSQGTTNPTQ